MAKPKRFEIVYKEGTQLSDEGKRIVFVDRLTGVNYLGWTSGNGAGLTPLIDSQGKPLVTREDFPLE